jgi:hypothetical protein
VRAVPPEQEQLDLSQWSLLDTFTVEDAACLWVGIDPSTSPTNRSKLELSQFTPIFKLLSIAIKDGILPVNLSRNLFAEPGKYSSSRVTRNDLKVFAKTKGVQPAFLFDTPAPKVGGNELLDAKTDPLANSRAGRPPACPKEDWLEQLVILALNKKIDLEDSQDAIAQTLVEALNKQGTQVTVNTVKRDWTGPIIRKAKAESK